MIKELMSYQVFIFAFSGIRRTHVNKDGCMMSFRLLPKLAKQLKL